MTTSSIQLQSLSPHQTHSFPWGELTWYANAELGNSSEMTVGRCILRAGASNPRHHHPNCSEILVVMQGRIRHTLDADREGTLEEGDSVRIPPRVWHRATNIGDRDAVLFIAFSSANRQTIGE